MDKKRQAPTQEAARRPRSGTAVKQSRPDPARPQREAAKRPSGKQPGREAPKRPNGEQPRREAPKRPNGEQPRREAARRPNPEQPRREAPKRPAAERPQRQAAQRPRREADKRSSADAARRRQAERRRAQSRTAAARKPAPDREPVPEVIYTPASPFHRGHFLLRLLTVLAVVVSLVLGISIFFKVRTVTVTGAEKYTPWDVREASGIQEGDNLLTFGKPKACGKIKAALPYVKSVRIGIKLPDTVNIGIEEVPVVYSISDESGRWWLMTAEGRVVEKLEASLAGEYTRVRGVQLEAPAAGKDAVAAVEPTDPSDTAGDPMVPGVSANERLSAALSILQNLEMNSMIGTVTEVNVANTLAIELRYGQQYEVYLGDLSQLNYKIASLKQVVEQLAPYQSGVLDVSYSRQEGVIYTPEQ